MQQEYESIARRLSFCPQAVHLVHYVLKYMKAGCVFPPSPVAQTEGFYTPANICSALLAYLRANYPENMWETLAEFGLTSSRDVGTLLAAIQEDESLRVVDKLEIDRDAFDGLFVPGEAPSDLKLVTWIHERQANVFPQNDTTDVVLSRHFTGIAMESLVITRRKFPGHVAADLQLSLNQLFEKAEAPRLFGINSRHQHDGIDFRLLTETDSRMATRIGPLTYSEVDIGGDETVSCLSSGLWLSTHSAQPYAVVLGAPPVYAERRQIQIEIAVPESHTMCDFARTFLNQLEQLVESSRCYRGKILSFERSSDYRGYAAAISVHELAPVERHQLVLPTETLNLLDRNVLEFVRQRPALARRGMSVKKGLLLFGPPGTGKTHTIHYLSQVLPNTTTLIISSEQIGLLSEYMKLARLLQPSLVVIEDADLIARQRENMGACEEILLNKLLNEMDGLRKDSEIIFILTTNRPDALEAALVARPGRIDQAIEYPLPNADGRRQLARLYAGAQQLEDDVVEHVVERTENVSAAFIKELMRRSTLYAISRGENESISIEDVAAAVDEMLFSAGLFNRRILGGATTEN